MTSYFCAVKKSRERLFRARAVCEAYTSFPRGSMKSCGLQICSDRSGNVALLKLPVDDSAVLRLKYAHGYSGAEIAAILDLTEAAVRKRISRAKKRLAKLLAEGDDV